MWNFTLNPSKIYLIKKDKHLIKFLSATARVLRKKYETVYKYIKREGERAKMLIEKKNKKNK